MRKSSRILGFICAVLLIMTMPAYATENQLLTEKEIVTPQLRFSNINILCVDFGISSSGKARVESVLSARDCDKVKINMYLQRYQNGNWVSIKSWSDTRNSTSMLLSKEWYVASGYQYRMKSYGYVYNNGQLVESSSLVSQSIIY